MDVARLIAAHEHARSDPALAEALCRAALDEDPDEPFALHLAGVLALRAGRPRQAQENLARAARARPDHAETLLALAEAELRSARPAAAAETLRQVLKIRPRHAAAWAALAMALLRAGNPTAALDAASRAKALEPDGVEPLVALGTALSAMRRPDAAIPHLAQAVALAPEHARARHNLGNALLDLDREEEAEEALRASIALDPGCAEAWASLGFLLAGTDRLREAIDACDTAIRLRPDFAEAYWNRSFARLRGGDPGGWADYEWRRRHPHFAHFDLPGPQWAGESLAGRHLLVHATQGLGDTIQMARYLPELARQAGRVTLACAPPLLRLLAPLATVVSRDAPLPDHDVWVDQMSLPRLIPGIQADGYLARPRRRCDGTLLRVGLVGAGNSAHSNDRRRSMRPGDLLPLREVAGVAWSSLQPGPAGEALAAAFGIAPAAGDFADTAEVVAGLDLVIAVDTSTAHLAGAMGVPVWILLPRAPDWRWLAGTDRSPWYPSARLFRQTRAGAWGPVVAEIAEALARRVEARHAAVP